MRTLGDPLRFTAGEAHDEQLRIGERVGRGVAIGGGAEDDGLVVGREFDFEFLARVCLPAGESGIGRQCRTGQQVAGAAERQTVVVECLHEDAHLAFIEPVVPAADRKAVVDARVRFAGAKLFDQDLVSRVVLRLRIHERHECQVPAVVRKHRRPGAAGQVGDALGLASRLQIHASRSAARRRFRAAR